MYIYIYICMYYIHIIHTYIYRIKIKDRVLRFPRNRFVFQVFTKVTILLYLFDVVQVSSIEMTSY